MFFSNIICNYYFHKEQYIRIASSCKFPVQTCRFYYLQSFFKKNLEFDLNLLGFIHAKFLKFVLIWYSIK